MNQATRDTESGPGNELPGQAIDGAPLLIGAEGIASVVQARTHRAMGTTFTVYIAGESVERARPCCDEVFDEIDRLERTFSRFLLNSELSRINRSAAEYPVVTDPEVFQLLATALDVCRFSSGAFDITIGPLTRAWGFANRQARIPSDEELNAALAITGWENVLLDPMWRTVEFRKAGVELDLGAIAKGYAVDCAIDLLSRAEVSAAIDAGSSSIAATGTHASGQAWRVSVPHPADRKLAVSEVELGDRALSTSGSFEQSHEAEGKTYSHLIDPRSASAAVRWQQVTVLAPSSALADALSTAMYVLGPNEGPAVLDQVAGCCALWVRESGEGFEFREYRWPGEVSLVNKEGIRESWTDVNS